MPKEHLSQVGKIIYGDSPEGKPWIQARYDELDEGCLNPWCKRCTATQANTKRPGNVFATSGTIDAGMRYPKFHKQGFCTSTGVVEAGCKVVIGTRLKRAGMHGRKRAQTRSSPCAAANLADDLRISGTPFRSKEDGRMTYRPILMYAPVPTIRLKAERAAPVLPWVKLNRLAVELSRRFTRARDVLVS